MKYRDREGHSFDVETSQDKFLKRLYGNVVGRAIMTVFSKPFVSNIIAAYMNSPLSAFSIDKFVKKNKIKMSDYIPCRYKSYNEFFTRRIRADKRKINNDPSIVISPSDGKVTVYPINLKSVMKIKNSRYTVESLLKNSELAHSFNGGYAVVIRLTVDNYHRYCYIDSGKKSENYFIPGTLHTVNPAALLHYKIYAENCREYTIINSKHFGKIVQMEVGAMGVGRIKNYHGNGLILRGQEKGYFEFGGSSIVLLFQRDQISIDEDILKNSREGYETIVKMGEGIGRVIVD